MAVDPIHAEIDAALKELEHRLKGPKYAKYVRFLVASLSSIPWVGAFIAASTALHSEIEQGRANDIVCQWIRDHQRKLGELHSTLELIVDRVEKCEYQIPPRLDDEEYLSLVRQGFKVWDSANTQSKRDYVRRTLTNAATTSICPDDFVRIFLDWIDQYDETHFKVIRVLFQNRGATRAFIWEQIGGVEARDDSAEADLFKLLMDDLSLGHVLRQIRQTNERGEFLVKRSTRKSGIRPSVLVTAFEDSKPYELTALGEQFATYVLNEALPRIGESPASDVYIAG